MSQAARGVVLQAWAALIETHRSELAELLTTEIGKPIRAADEVEVQSCINSVMWYGEAASKFGGSHSQSGPSSISFVNREPAGVVAVVLPWNFPLSMVGFDVAPALAAGNAVLVKPSPLAPLAVLRICELALEAGVPANVLAVLPDDGLTAGAAIGRHPMVDVVSVTGSQEAGRAFFQYASEGPIRRIWPKLGGKSFASVASDCSNLAAAADALSWGAFFNQGAMCTGCSRIYVERGIYDDFCSEFMVAVKRLKTGNPFDRATDVGALINEKVAISAKETVSDAIDLGGALFAGTGTVYSLSGSGRYLEPCVLGNVPRSAKIMNEEVFAPICALVSCGSILEAVEESNHLRLGMALSVWTESLRLSLEISRRAKVGTIWINSFEGDDLTVPFGGVRSSGFGRDKSMLAIDKYSDQKTVWIDTESSSWW